MTKKTTDVNLRKMDLQTVTDFKVVCVKKKKSMKKRVTELMVNEIKNNVDRK